MKTMAELGRLLVASLVVVGAPLAGQDAPDRGEEIVREVERRSRGYGDLEAGLVMRILEGDRERIREMHVRGLESEDGNRTRMTLERPADMAGTEFLSALEDDGERHQWIYLPAARRVRRISGARSSDSFLGSHFTYDDMTPPKVEGFTYRWIRDEEISGQPGAVIERTSLDDRTEYPVNSCGSRRNATSCIASNSSHLKESTVDRWISSSTWKSAGSGSRDE